MCVYHCSKRNNEGGGCCCDKRGAALCFSIIGLLLATAVIVPPVYIYLHDKDYSIIFPLLKFAKIYLKSAMDVDFDVYIKNVSTISSQMEPKEKYTLAIFQLLDDTEKLTPCLAFFSFCMGCVNVPLDIFLFFGAIFRTPCALLPWLFITLIEIIVVGIPLIVYSGLISLYLASQLSLYIEAIIILGVVVTLFFLSLSSWYTVYGCYYLFGRRISYLESSEVRDSQLTQPLLPPESQPPPSHPPPGHLNQGYHLGQYPQYYPPHSQTRQLPSAPPQTNPPNHGIYPSLSNA